MITVISKMILKPGKLPVFLEGWTDLIVQYRKESGCTSYNVLLDTKNENICFVVGEWDSEEAYQQHLDSPFYQQAYSYSIGWLAKEPDTSICSIVI
jgi:quinol monooxygenase YgiN